MDTRRLPLLLVLVLLPVPAQADRHFTECFVGISPEKQQAIAARLSCGIRLVGILVNDVGQATPVTGDLLKGTARLRAALDTGAEPAKADGGPSPTKRSLFLFAEAAEYIAGMESGHTVDGWMIGLRYSMRGQSAIEPFFHGMGGLQYPSGPNATAGDNGATGTPRPRVRSGAAAVGGGVDIEINPLEPGEKPPNIVPVLRLQVDLVESWTTPGFHPYARATFGVSFRYEGHAGHR